MLDILDRLFINRTVFEMPSDFEKKLLKMSQREKMGIAQLVRLKQKCSGIDALGWRPKMFD